MFRKHRWPRIAIPIVLTVAVLTLLVTTAVRAQTSQQPIVLGDNKTGQITAADPAPAFVFNATAGQTVTALVLSLTPGYVPALRVVDPAGAIAQDQPNPTGSNTVQATVTTAQTGPYQFIVQTANGVGGQFVISLQASNSATPASNVLALDAPQTSSVDPATPNRVFSFNASPSQPLTLRVTSVSVTGGPSVTLVDGATGEVIAASGPRVLESSFRIPPGSSGYQVQVDFGNTSAFEQFIIALESGNGAPSGEPTIPPPPGVTATLAPTATGTLLALPVTGPCVVASAGAERVNIRSGPGTGYSVVTQITLTQIVPVTGRLGDNSWFQVSVSGLVGWVSTSVVRIGGDCGGVPIIALPTATPAPTLSFTATPTSPGPSATDTVTQPPSATPSWTPTSNFIPVTLVFKPTLKFIGTLALIPTATPTLKLILPGNKFDLQPINPIVINTPGP